MTRITAALTYEGDACSQVLIDSLASSPAVGRVLIVQRGPVRPPSLSAEAIDKITFIDTELPSGAGITRLLGETASDYLLLILPGQRVEPGQRALERMLSVADDSRAGLTYSDFRDDYGPQVSDHPLTDYQQGSIRDSFDFGSVLLVSKRAADAALRNHGPVDDGLWYAGLYDLRLKLSVDSPVLRIPEPLYTRIPADLRATGEKQFDYVDPRKRDYQVEMEAVATEHLKRIGAYLAPEFKAPPPATGGFPVRASVVIPVRNRERTIEEAVMSALSQQAPFDFNVLVVDNHSTDRTTEILAGLARKHGRLVHLTPARTDLGIGGCWNEAVFSQLCGKYAAQLDSDDLYADDRTLEKVVAKFEEGAYGMVIGSYTIVNFDLQVIPPGLIDHREWTRENGRNNALRINGLGAPRAFDVAILRQVGLPNASYGEDYAAALRISRDYEIGRIYDSIYYARRWEGNSDAALPLATANRYDAYKDYLRTVEILARKRMNQR
ncbi:MAG TPA: glycosyltransferase family A protein [Blastocatellia bacterium]|nr:glycosyltransferase family A protein [Blastocatellia bacterium]